MNQATALVSKARPKRANAREFIADVVDPSSFQSWDIRPAQPPAGPAYANELAAAEKVSGSDEAVVTGEGLLDGKRIAVIAGEFGFLGGSVGAATARRLINAVERATMEGLPLLASPASGGTRMQEGTKAFLSMVGITAAVERHKATGNLYLVYLRHPTTGGAMASWGSLGQITFAEPGALLGFLGPRVYEALHGTPFPAGVQTAENLYRHGIVDAVLPPSGLRSALVTVLGYTSVGRPELPVLVPTASGSAPTAGETPDAWECVSRSRRPGRPGIQSLLRHGAEDVVQVGEATGDGLTVALARFGAARCVVVGHDNAAQRDGALIGPGALRRARRGMGLASELGLPLLSVIDTPGAELSAAAEEGGLAGEIARCIAAMVAMEVPTVSLILGPGTGGAAIALLPADRLICAQNGWLAPLPPEGASVIVHRHTGQAPELARHLGIRAADLHAEGIADHIIRETIDAADEPVNFCLRTGHAIEEALTQLLAAGSGSDAERSRARVNKYSGVAGH